LNEWGFAAEVKSWWDAEFQQRPEWALDRCEVERREEGSLKRSDLVVWSGGTVQIAGEVRLPDHVRSSPWDQQNLSGAIDKALTQGARWAFTSDAKELLLIDVQKTGPPQARVVHHVELSSFEDRARLDSAAFLNECRQHWLEALGEIAPIVLGFTSPSGMSPDEVFVAALRALLRAPVSTIRDELNRKRQMDPIFEQRLVEWMVDKQGWTHAPSRWEEEVNRVAQLTSYVFTTRLVFYEALRRSQPSLSPLSLPDNVGAGVAKRLVRAYFDEARERSGDYETLFEWDEEAEYAFVSDGAVPGWRRVIEHLAAFDLASLGYDVVGKLFERLIEPHERYRWGQHYTNPNVCDLMLSFAIPDGEGAILDPAAGGGTFLVRAYVRKRVLHAEYSHQDVLAELYGLDVSPFAASLSTVNLAARDLAFSDNYPRMAPASFFNVSPGGQFITLPAPRLQGLGSAATEEIALEPVRAVVCNPPYVRVRELGSERRREVEEFICRPAKQVPVPTQVGGLSNYHVYFWLHGAQFLRDDGRLVFITAGEWLDSDYGVALQQWLLQNFTIECCIESLAEPWFSEARVGTVITVAQLCTDEQQRNANQVKFVLLRQPLADLYGPYSSEQEHLASVDRLRDRILDLEEEAGEAEDLDWSVIRQADLLALGTAAEGE